VFSKENLNLSSFMHTGPVLYPINILILFFFKNNKFCSQIVKFVLG